MFDPKYCEIVFENYISRTWDKCSVINTLIFPNQQILIDRLYHPLSIIDDNEEIKIDSFPIKLFDKYKRILICDNAGMGKSTMSKFICIQAIKNNIGIPIFIELKNLNSENTILKEFSNQLTSIDKVYDEEFVLRLLTLNKFVIILDGFDEIVNKDLEFVTKDIKNFVLKSSNNLFLLTSRPDSSITSFGDFKNTYIAKLSQSESFDLLRKYDEISCKNISAKLISEIESKREQTRDFLTNPFLVSLLYKSYSFKKNVPSKKSTFYNEVYTALFQEHDLSKDSYHRDKISKLDIQDFRIVLREFAIMTSKIGEVEYSKQKAIKYLNDCQLNIPSIELNSNKFIEDLLKTVPLFIKDGENIKWAHKSLQDYFAAEYIIFHPKKINIVNFLIKQDILKYKNILDLIIEQDPNLIRQYVLPDILNSFINHCEAPSDLQQIGSDDLMIRRCISFKTKLVISSNVQTPNKLISSNINFRKTVEKEDNKKLFSGYVHSKDIFFAMYFDNVRYMFQILGEKGFLGENILISDYCKNNPLNTLPKPLEEDLEKNLPKNLVLVNERQNSSYNDPLYFSFINKTICRYGFSHYSDDIFFVPKLDFCKDLLEVIKKEIKTTEENIFF